MLNCKVFCFLSVIYGCLWISLETFFLFSLGISCPYRQSEREERSAAFQTKSPLQQEASQPSPPSPPICMMNALVWALTDSTPRDLDYSRVSFMISCFWVNDQRSLFMMLVISLDWMTCVWHCAQPFSYLFSIFHFT